jgi:hypothetical protein
MDFGSRKVCGKYRTLTAYTSVRRMNFRLIRSAITQNKVMDKIGLGHSYIWKKWLVFQIWAGMRAKCPRQEKHPLEAVSSPYVQRQTHPWQVSESKNFSSAASYLAYPNYKAFFRNNSA